MKPPKPNMTLIEVFAEEERQNMKTQEEILNAANRYVDAKPSSRGVAMMALQKVVKKHNISVETAFAMLREEQQIAFSKQG